MSCHFEIRPSDIVTVEQSRQKTQDNFLTAADNVLCLKHSLELGPGVSGSVLLIHLRKSEIFDFSFDILTSIVEPIFYEL